MKHLTGTTGLYEIRIEYGSDIYRFFSFFDKGKLIILINGFQKKTQKTPKKEIELAVKCGTTKNYISRIENNASDIRLSTLMRIFKEGFGRQLKLTIG